MKNKVDDDPTLDPKVFSKNILSDLLNPKKPKPISKGLIGIICWSIGICAVIFGGFLIHDVAFTEPPQASNPAIYMTLFGMPFIIWIPSLCAVLLCIAFVVHGFVFVDLSRNSNTTRESKIYHGKI